MSASCSTCSACCNWSSGSVKNYAIFLGVFELVNLVRHFAFGVPFTDITKIFGPAPTPHTQKAFFAAITLIAIVRFVFAGRVKDAKLAKMNAVVHIVEAMIVSYFYSINIVQPVVLSLKGGAAVGDAVGVKTRVAIVIYFVIVFNGALFFNHWKNVVVTTTNGEDGDGGAKRRSVSSSSGVVVAAASTGNKAKASRAPSAKKGRAASSSSKSKKTTTRTASKKRK